MDRRTFLKSSAFVGMGAAAASAVPMRFASSAKAGVIENIKYKALVPEIFAPLADPPSFSQTLIIGSGFGGSISALRLAQAGVQVTVLERGSRWPRDPWREIFTSDSNPDGRGFWHRTQFTGVSGFTNNFDDFGGIFDPVDYPGIQVWRGACVGGGSMVFTGAMPIPERRFFDQVFKNVIDYDEMTATFYPRVQKMLNLSTMPDDIYNSGPFTHSRTWDQQSISAGYTPARINSIFNWDVVRAELNNQSRPSATAGLSNLGNSNGAKFDLNQNYIKEAEATGKATVFPGHQVLSIGRNSAGKYTVLVNKIDPTGAVLAQRTLTCDHLILGAGSIGTSELLVKAKATGTLPNLNSAIGQGWGPNGDAAVVRAVSFADLLQGQGSPSASRIVDEAGDLPVAFENWYVPGLPLDLGIVGTLGMTLDPTRSNFTYNSKTGKVVLNWTQANNARSNAAMTVVNNKIAAASGSGVGAGPFSPGVNTSFTAHPLGGAVIGQATDTYGRVVNYPGLYVLDGAAIPGSTGTVNPSLTISALAERNIATIIKNGA